MFSRITGKLAQALKLKVRSPAPSPQPKPIPLDITIPCDEGASVRAWLAGVTDSLEESNHQAANTSQKTSEEAAETHVLVLTLAEQMSELIDSLTISTSATKDMTASQHTAVKEAIHLDHFAKISAGVRSLDEMGRLGTALVGARSAVPAVVQQVAALTHIGNAAGQDQRTPAQLLCDCLNAQVRLLDGPQRDANMRLWHEAMCLFLPERMRVQMATGQVRLVERGRGGVRGTTVVASCCEALLT